MRISQTHGHTLRPKLCARNSKWSVQSNFQTIFRCGRSKVNIHKCSTDTRKKWLTLKHRYILQIYVLADRQRKTNKMSCRRHTHSPAFSSEAEASYIYGGLPKGGENSRAVREALFTFFRQARQEWRPPTVLDRRRSRCPRVCTAIQRIRKTFLAGS